MYTSRENAERAYVAYLAQEDDDEYKETTDAKGLLADEQSLGETFSQKEETYNDYPEAATNNAKRALRYKEENGSSCGTPVGWARARQLANKERISRDTIARMAAFARHLQYKDVPYSKGCGGLAVDAWGGQAGIEWAQKKLQEIKDGQK